MQISVSTLCTNLEGIIQEASKHISEPCALLGARKVSKLLITHNKPLTLKDIGENLGGRSIENLCFLKRYIDTATIRNWIRPSKSPDGTIAFEATRQLKLIEECLSGDHQQVKQYKKGIHDFNYWLKSITDTKADNDLSQLKEYEYCPLIAGIQSGNQQVIAHLTSQGATITPRPNQKATRSNVLHFLATTDYIRTVCTVLIERPHFLYKKNKKKKTPLDIAKSVGNTNMQRIFENKIKSLEDAKVKIAITKKQPDFTETETVIEPSDILGRMLTDEITLPDSEHLKAVNSSQLKRVPNDPEHWAQIALEQFDCFSEQEDVDCLPGLASQPVTDISMDQPFTSDRKPPIFDIQSEFKDLIKQCYPHPETKISRSIRNHFHDYILAAINDQPLPMIRESFSTSDNDNCFPVIIVGSTSFAKNVHHYWGHAPLTLLEGSILPEGVDKKLLYTVLMPRDIDLAVKEGFSFEEVTHIASKWLINAKNNCPFQLGKTRIAKCPEFIEGNLRIRRVLLLQDKPDPRTKDIVYALDLSKSIDSRSYQEEVREKLLIQGIDNVIRSEFELTQRHHGVKQRTLKAVTRLYLLGALETVKPKLDQLSRALLANTLRAVPYQDPIFNQLASSLEHAPLCVFM